MSGDISGWFEARDKHEQLLYRLFVRLDRDPPGLSRNAIMVVDGGVKRNESAFTDQLYADLRGQWERYLASNPRSVA